MNEDLRIIKKKFGEEMMHFCRESFATLIELYPGSLSTLLIKKFNASRFLYKDIIDNNLECDFKSFIYGFFDIKKSDPIKTKKTPYELFKEVGYTLYKCETEKDIQKFRKYYYDDEELCTFIGGKLKKWYVYFAVKDDIYKIIRTDFKKPKRQDLYGTSILSIQFSRDETHTLSIKNRYNHKVSYPDSTYSNNLDNIILGLTESFRVFEGMNQTLTTNILEIPGYIKAKDGKYYKYNYEINNIYYCPDDIIIKNFIPIKLPKEQMILADYFIIDYSKNKIILIDDTIKDSFTDTFGEIKNISKKNNNNFLEIVITPSVGDEIIITINKEGHIISYENPNIRTIGNKFLYFNKTLVSINLENVETIGNCFLKTNTITNFINLPNLKVAGNSFLYQNQGLAEINLPNLEIIGDYFLAENDTLTSLSLENIRYIGSFFLSKNRCLNFLNIEKVKIVGNYFLWSNLALDSINLPNIKSKGSSFLYKNNRINQNEEVQYKILKK